MNKTVLQVIVAIVLTSVVYWRYSTQLGRVKSFLEKDYTEVEVIQGYKSSILKIERCTQDDELYFSFSGLKDEKMYAGDLCCKNLYFLYEFCEILSEKTVNSSK